MSKIFSSSCLISDCAGKKCMRYCKELNWNSVIFRMLFGISSTSHSLIWSGIILNFSWNFLCSIQTLTSTSPSLPSPITEHINIFSKLGTFYPETAASIMKKNLLGNIQIMEKIFIITYKGRLSIICGEKCIWCSVNDT